ncbi:transglycosylase SLT domain-containing protein [Sphingomonas sp. MAH-20]|uniref:Transglycosylase SLT domain-containing protein n=1 Tax=Sphingomonas horti TaxID=2682842 RepID=A0A6I4IWH3_9SPHN|nr:MULTISPECIES: lytic transglycosylase domain-containing protein [Sphingomonas]MBA2920256.1 lytic transglycosylase domain-containing protein [Sphingomonas sp. CGMCC 1.13658]MVO76510.1 transglycosylase SLT domain-containing protein [Sphingomonas horti]
MRLAPYAACLLAAVSVPALADGSRNAAVETHGIGQLPAVLGDSEKAAYLGVFADMKAGLWTEAAAKIDALPDGPLKYYARAELYTEKGSPKVTNPDELTSLAAAAPWLPQAPQLVALARTRGAAAIPDLPAQQRLIWLGSAPARERADTIRNDPVAAQLAPKILPLIKIDDPAGCEAILSEQAPNLSGPALTEWRQRVAWSYYLNGDDTNARRLADLARKGGEGEWRVQADWTSGLASWRLRDYADAAEAFSAVASRGGDPDIRAAGHYWAARALMAAAEPQKIQAHLRAAAQYGETFYGILAAEALGLKQLPPGEQDDLTRAWSRLAAVPNVRVAKALAEIGERDRASQALKFQARLGRPEDHALLASLAARLNLPETQLYLAHNGPSGAQPSSSARYPMPDWRPVGGWRVDKSLIYAHALQESRFRPDAISPAGAYGVMQVLPGTAQLIARRRGERAPDRTALLDPAINLDFGQARLEHVRDYGATGGLLPKVIMAYNAGPGMLDEWNVRVKGGNDPLLFMESIPFWETRGYAVTVMRNYWMYERNSGQKSPSLKALAQDMWPRFPGLPGAKGVRLEPRAPIEMADARTMAPGAH